MIAGKLEEQADETSLVTRQVIVGRVEQSPARVGVAVLATDTVEGLVYVVSAIFPCAETEVKVQGPGV